MTGERPVARRRGGACCVPGRFATAIARRMWSAAPCMPAADDQSSDRHPTRLTTNTPTGPQHSPTAVTRDELPALPTLPTCDQLSRALPDADQLSALPGTRSYRGTAVLLTAERARAARRPAVAVPGRSDEPEPALNDRQWRPASSSSFDDTTATSSRIGSPPGLTRIMPLRRTRPERSLPAQAHPSDSTAVVPAGL